MVVSDFGMCTAPGAEFVSTGAGFVTYYIVCQRVCDPAPVTLLLSTGAGFI